MLSRPSDQGHTRFGDIFYSESPDLIYWGKHRHVMAPTLGWQSTKIGAGPTPIETNIGWLLIYHAVDNKMYYRLGLAFLDLNDPTKVIYRHPEPILEPEEEFEKTGDVSNVTFTCGAVVKDETLFIYYGAADTVICVATADMKDVLRLF